jgi:hypothetical protein
MKLLVMIEMKGKGFVCMYNRNKTRLLVCSSVPMIAIFSGSGCSLSVVVVVVVVVN